MHERDTIIACKRTIGEKRGASRKNPMMGADGIKTVQNIIQRDAAKLSIKEPDRNSNCANAYDRPDVILCFHQPVTTPSCFISSPFLPIISVVPSDIIPIMPV